MPFYARDGIQEWFRVCIEEKTDAMGEDETGVYVKHILANIENLKEECGEFLNMAMNNDSDSLADAIMNSVDWTDLTSDICKYYSEDYPTMDWVWFN